MLEIKIPSRIKTSSHNRTQLTLRLLRYEKDLTVCAASALDTYVTRTKDLRGNTVNLFISWKRPHKAVSTQNLSRWIKSMLQKSGLDTTIFSAYSTLTPQRRQQKELALTLTLSRKRPAGPRSPKLLLGFMIEISYKIATLVLQQLFKLKT